MVSSWYLFNFLTELICPTYFTGKAFSTGPWKKKNLADLGVVTQCIAPLKVNDQYLTNVLLKINAKVSFTMLSPLNV